MQQQLSDIRSHNFIIIVKKMNKEQKNQLIEKFKPSEGKIKTKKIDDQIKLLFRKCRQSMNQDQIRAKANKILKQEVQVRLLQGAAIKILSPYETQDSSSDDVQKLKIYATLSLEMILKKKKSDELKTQIMDEMEKGLKLIEIFVKYPDKSEQQMIVEFWDKLEQCERMMLKKEQCMLQIKQNQLSGSNKNEQLFAISMEYEQQQISNEQILSKQDDGQESEKIIEKRNEMQQKFQKVSVQGDVENDLKGNGLNEQQNDLNEEEKEEKQQKHQKLGLIDKTIKKTPIKNNVESVNQLPGVEKFVKKQNQANKINKNKRFNKWDQLLKKRQEDELLRFQKLKEQNKK